MAPQFVLDTITDDESLIRYAATAQIANLDVEHGINQAEIADTMKVDQAYLTKALKQQPTLDFLHRLDTALKVLVPDTPAGLVTFAARLRKLRDRDSVGARVPISLVPRLLKKHFTDPEMVIIQASALLSMFHGAFNHEHEVADRYQTEIAEIADRLILIGITPPTPDSVKALLLLGNIGSFAFPYVQPCLERELHTNPLGFRVWRAATAVVWGTDARASALAAPPENDGSTTRPAKGSEKSAIRAAHRQAGLEELTRQVQEWMSVQLGQAAELRKRSIYPARSLDLETAKAIPVRWTPPGDDWAARMLLERARMSEASIRERGSAALGYWARALQHHDLRNDRAALDRARAELTEVATQLENASETEDLGHRWVAATLRDNMKNDRKVSNTWPTSGSQPAEFRAVVDRAMNELNVLPRRIQTATKFMFQHSLLQNAGVYRRRAVDTLRVTGWSSSLIRAYGQVLERSDDDWLKCRALFAIGFLQARHSRVATTLEAAAAKAEGRLDGSRGRVGVMHDALFAAGDSFGAADATPAQVSEIRARLDPIVARLLANDVGRAQPALSRAIAYLTWVTARADPPRSQEILEELSGFGDDVTASTAKWALKSLVTAGPGPLDATPMVG